MKKSIFLAFALLCFMSMSFAQNEAKKDSGTNQSPVIQVKKDSAKTTALTKQVSSKNTTNTKYKQNNDAVEKAEVQAKEIEKIRAAEAKQKKAMEINKEATEKQKAMEKEKKDNKKKKS